MKIAILFGGRSTEHEVSCVSASSVLTHIDPAHTIFKIGITKDGEWFHTDAPSDKIADGSWMTMPKKPVTVDFNVRAFVADGVSFTPDVIFPVLHGKNGEDGTVQGLFELMRVPYVGCKVLASSVCMDKAYANRIFREAGINHVDFVTVEQHEYETDEASVKEKIVSALRFPVFIKPANAGSSVGISRCKTPAELDEALRLAFTVDRRVVAETGVEDPAEIEVAVLGNDEPIASCSGRIIPANDFYDYEAKYESDNSLLRIPSGFEREDELRALAVKAYKACDCKGLSRVDFLVSKTGEIFLNEINTMPGFTSISMFPKLFAASGIPYTELIDRLLHLALEN